MNQSSLNGKVAIITGGGKGIGLGVAKAYAKEGVAVVLTGRTISTLEHGKREIEEQVPGAKVLLCPGDGKDHEMAQRVVNKTIETFGRLDIVVNNAQQFLPDTRVENFTHEDLIATYESGLFAAWRYMVAAFPHLKAVEGTVINMGSASGTKSLVNECAYGGNKEAMRHLSRVAAKEWGEYGITVNVVCPAVASETALEYAAQNPDWEEAFLSEFPLRKWGDAELHVGGTCVFLAKPEGKYITGSTIDVDGGFTIRP